MNVRMYEALAARTRRPMRGPLPDADVVILLAVLSPAFLAVVVGSLVRGQSIDSGATVCGALVVLAVLVTRSAWRGRARRPDGSTHS